MSDGSRWGISGEQGPELPVNPRAGKRTLADIEARADELAQRFMDFDPNPEIVDSSDAFAVKWSDEDGEWVATCDQFPSLSWLAASPLEALDGLLRAMA